MELLGTLVNTAAVFVVGLLLAFYLKGRFEQVDRRFEHLEARMDAFQASLDSVRSDLTRVALAVGADPRAENA
jgi:hypothetical protein